MSHNLNQRLTKSLFPQSIVTMAIFLAAIFVTSFSKAQNVIYVANEEFPNTYNTGFTGNITSTFTGNMGTWTASSNQTFAALSVNGANSYWSTPNAVFIRNFNGGANSTVIATSPVIDLTSVSCSDKVSLQYGLYTGKLWSSPHVTYRVEFSNNGGTSWFLIKQQTAAQLLATVANPTGWNDMYEAIDAFYLTSTFRYRITALTTTPGMGDFEIEIDDMRIQGDACRTTWTNICADNKDVDLYTKSMTNSCANNVLGWTNIGTTEGLNMTNATQVKLYVSTSEDGNPTRTVTVRSKNAAGTVLQTLTSTTPFNNQEAPSPINIYEFTFSSLAGVASFEATVAGGCSTSSLSGAFIANGMGLAVFRNSVTGNYNRGGLWYWGAPGNGIWNFSRTFYFPTTTFTKTAMVEVTISGLANNGKKARILVMGPNGTVTTDVMNTDPAGGRIMKVFIPYPNLAPAHDNIFVTTDFSIPENGMYSIDAVKVTTTCTQPVNLGNMVFNDANNNGIRDGGETGIPGLRVNLYEDANTNNSADGKVLYQTVTDASGNYNFTGLLPGSYIVGVVIPNGYTSGSTTGTSANPNNDTNDDNNGVTLANGGTELRTNFITLSVAGEPAGDGDGADGNLTLDLGLRTNSCVKTTEHFPNTFNLGYISPVNSTFVGSSGTWDANCVNSYSTILVTTPYYSPSSTYAIKLANAATNGGNTDAWCGTTSPVINVSGNCCPLQTKLNFTLWTRTLFVDDIYSHFSVEMSGDGGATWYKAYSKTAPQLLDLYGVDGKGNISIPIPTSLQTNNFRYKLSLYSSWNTVWTFYVFIDDISISSPITCGTGSIGNYVWNDANTNGTQDAGETGISGVTVTLKNNDGAIITTTTTNGSGNYTFSNLEAADYQVSFTTPAGFNPTWSDQGGDDTDDSDPIGTTIKNITLTNGQNRTDIDAGFFPICSNLFSETFPNTYNLTYTTPSTGTFTGNLGTWNVVSSSNMAGLTVEFNGSTNLVKTYNWIDWGGTHSVSLTSPALDLIQGAGCTQLAYLNFEIYPDFINTPPGSNSYMVYIDFSGNGGSTWSNAWAMNGADIIALYGLRELSNISIGIPGSVYTTNFRFRLRTEQSPGSSCDNITLFDNFQIRKCPCPPLALGNLLWEDTNNDGIKDVAESGINGATVRLYNDNNGDNLPDGSPIQTTTTSGGGFYSFTQLVPGNYIVGVIFPAGYIATATTGTSSNPNNDTNHDNNGVNVVPGELRSNGIVLTVGGEPASGVDGDGTNGNQTLDFGMRNGVTCVGNLLTNNGFESGLTSWTQTGGPWSISTDSYTGMQSAQISGIDGYLGQGVTGVPGNLYTLRGFGKLTGGAEWASIGIEFLDASFVVLSSQAVQVNSTSYQEYIVTGVAPAGTAYVQVFGYKWTGGGTLKIDQYCLTTTAYTCASNQVLNPGFEATPDFTNWTKSGTPANVNITSDAYAGTRAAQISGGDGGIYQQFPATAGESFVLKLFGKVTGGAEYNGFGLQFYNSSNVLLNEVGESFTTNTYTEKTVALTAPVGTAYINIWIWKDAGSAVYKVDEFNLCKTVAATDPLKIGNLVWNDLNGNGLKGTVEPGINGVTVYLFQDANTDNVPDGAALATTVTGTNGVYVFNNLAPGSFIVSYVLPTGFANTFKPANNANPNSNIDDDNNGVTKVGNQIRSNFITLSVGGEPLVGIDGDGPNGNLTLDFGCARDTDGDDIADPVDIDDDNDGITDVNESGGCDPLLDADNDGIPSYQDSNSPGCLAWADCNSDGINDNYDWDRDGIINELDLDSDNDGIVDVIESRPNGAVFGSISNGQITGTDADANGLLSSADNNSGFTNLQLNGIIAQDLDRDGTPNYLDLDSDADGMTDLTEARSTYDADGIVNGTDTDGDGVRGETFGNNGVTVADNVNGLAAKGITLLDTDGDTYPNAYDIDSDNDGITDNTEAQPTCSYRAPLGTDCDNDGVDDNYDVGGCASCLRTSSGITPFDKESDATPDYLDTDTDGDGALDIYEGHTISSQVPPVNYWTGSLGDADRDGLIDFFDIFNMTTETSLFFSNVTSNNLGTNGSYSPAVAKPGSRVQLPQRDGLGPCPTGERDWRTISVLPVSLVSFQANLNNNLVKLNWLVAGEINMSHYDVERSNDGVAYKKVASVNAQNNSSNANTSYTVDDNLMNEYAPIVYYKIKLVEKNGVGKYSNVVTVKPNSKSNDGISIAPNPAISNFNLKVVTAKTSTAQIKVVSMMGKVVINQNSNVTIGSNTISFSSIGNLSAGTYNVQVVIDGKVYNEKLVISK